MNKKELRYAFNKVLSAAESIECKDLHHKESHQHADGFVCPAEYELHRCVNIVREYMKENAPLT